MNYSDEFLKKAHGASFENKSQIIVSSMAGCFYCKKIYPVSDITEDDYIQDKNDETVLCPACGIDSVIGDASGIELTAELLDAMHSMYF